MNELKITLVQTELKWEDITGNVGHFTSLIERITEPTDIIVLPEMFATGFSMHADRLAENMDGGVIDWMQRTAKVKNAVLCGSLIIKDGESFVNRLIWAQPDGVLKYYDKRHLFRMAEEQLHYTAGKEKLIIEYKGWKIFPIVCYDLRFPVWLRRTREMDYDLMIVVANWPERRVVHWKALLQARAIENQCYVAGVNRIGTDGNGIYHSGDSSLFDPKGELIFQLAHEPFIHTFILNKTLIEDYRKSFPVIEDADQFSIN